MVFWHSTDRESMRLVEATLRHEERLPGSAFFSLGFKATSRRTSIGRSSLWVLILNVSTDDQNPALQLAALKKAGCQTVGRSTLYRALCV